MSCSHTNIRKEIVHRTFLDLTFSYKTLVCKDCGGYMRDEAYEKAYMEWLEQTYRNLPNRYKFQIQCHFSNKLMSCLDEYLQPHPGISATVFLRLLATIYLNVVEPDEALSKQFDSLLDNEIYEAFSNDKEKKRANIQFKPTMMIDILAIAEALELRPSIIIETSILKMMTAIVSKDKALKKFWDKEISTYLSVFLKAA